MDAVGFYVVHGLARVDLADIVARVTKAVGPLRVEESRVRRGE